MISVATFLADLDYTEDWTSLPLKEVIRQLTLFPQDKYAPTHVTISQNVWNSLVGSIGQEGRREPLKMPLGYTTKTVIVSPIAREENRA